MANQDNMESELCINRKDSATIRPRPSGPKSALAATFLCLALITSSAPAASSILAASGQKRNHSEVPEAVSLKTLATWLRTIGASVKEKDKEDPAKIKVAQLNDVYMILNKLQNTRGAYIESIHSLIEAKQHHLPEDTAVARSENVSENAKLLWQQLQILDTALQPLQLNLDLKNPTVALSFRRYEQPQWAITAKGTHSDVVGTYTTKELKRIETDAKTNGKVLQESIDELRQLLKQLNTQGAA